MGVRFEAASSTRVEGRPRLVRERAESVDRRTPHKYTHPSPSGRLPHLRAPRRAVRARELEEHLYQPEDEGHRDRLTRNCFYHVVSYDSASAAFGGLPLPSTLPLLRPPPSFLDSETRASTISSTAPRLDAATSAHRSPTPPLRGGATWLCQNTPRHLTRVHHNKFHNSVRRH